MSNQKEWSEMTYEEQTKFINDWAESSIRNDKGDAAPKRRLTCTCCGESTEGRQWWNLDTGYGLCEGCVEQCTRDEPDPIRTNTYGTRGVHFDLDFDTAPDGSQAALVQSISAMYSPEERSRMLASILLGLEYSTESTSDNIIHSPEDSLAADSASDFVDHVSTVIDEIRRMPRTSRATSWKNRYDD